MRIPLDWCPHLPTEKQIKFFQRNEREVLYGGAAGGGKSDALLMAALQYVDVPGYAAILFRRTYQDLSLPGALMDRARAWLTGKASWNEQKKLWTFPSGALLAFGYLDTAADKYRYQSSEFQFIGFDELTQFGESEYLYLFSRLRRGSTSTVPLRMRGATNPGGIGHDWVRRRFIDEPDDRVFVSAALSDNPHLDQNEYRQSLANLDDTTRRQLLDGDWTANDDGLLDYDLIESCQDDSTLWPDGVCPGGRPELYLGLDVGRTKDLSVLWTWEKVGDVCWCREILEMDGWDFRRQKEAIKERITRDVVKLQGDKGGIGYQLMEELEREYPAVVEGVQLTPGRQGQLGALIRVAFRERRVRVPDDPVVRDDFRLVKQIDTRNGAPVIQTERSAIGHADRFWAAALGYEAANYETPPPKVALPRTYVSRR